jgi:hypothetical protein
MTRTKSAGICRRPRTQGVTTVLTLCSRAHAPDGVAVIFEAKVLSDVSTHVTFDVARNQLARTIDVMLEETQHSVPAEPPETRPDLPGAANPGTHAKAGRRACDQQEQALRLAHARIQRPGQLTAPAAPAPSRPPRIGRSRQAPGMGKLGRLPHRRPGRLPVAYTNSERPVTTINHDPTERPIRARSGK